MPAPSDQYYQEPGVSTINRKRLKMFLKGVVANVLWRGDMLMSLEISPRRRRQQRFNWLAPY